MWRRNHRLQSEFDDDYSESEDGDTIENPIPRNQRIDDGNFKMILYKEKSGNKEMRKRLWVFPTPENKKECYEYFWSNYYGLFLCCACEAMKPKNYATAIILKRKNQKDAVEVGRTAHKCQIRKYDHKKFRSFYDRRIADEPAFVKQWREMAKNERE